MSIAQMLADDTAHFVTTDGDELVITSPDGTLHNVHCFLYNIGVSDDAEGYPIVAERCAMDISLVELKENGIDKPEWLKEDGWNAVCRGVEYRFDDAPIDYTLGRVVITCKVLKQRG